MLVPATARAQSGVSAADKHTARQLVGKGDQQFAQGNYDAALESYRGAHIIMGVPTTGWEVARTQVALGRLIEARKTLQEVIAFRQAQSNKAFEAARGKAKRLLADLDERVPTLSVRVAGAPEGTPVTVAIDGATMTAPDQPQPVNPGDHEVLVSAPGLQDVNRTVTLGERDRTVVKLVLSPPPEAAESSGAWPLAYTGFAIAGAGIIAGAITGGLSLQRAEEVKSRCPSKINCPRNIMSTQQESVTLAHVSTTSFAVAGAGAVLGVIAMVVALNDDDPEPVPSSAIVVTPMLGPGLIGIQGAF